MLKVERTTSRIILLVGRIFIVATNEMVKIFISYGDGVRVSLCVCGGIKMKENTKCETYPLY